jgi:hypothetical protein
MTDEPNPWPLIPAALCREISATHARMKAGLATIAEIEAIEEELREVPGFSQWEARQMLNQALRREKAMA